LVWGDYTPEKFNMHFDAVASPGADVGDKLRGPGRRKSLAGSKGGKGGTSGEILRELLP